MTVTSSDEQPDLSENCYLIGADYDETANLYLSQVAEILHKDLADVQSDGLILSGLDFSVTADETESGAVIRITVSGIDQMKYDYDMCVQSVINPVFGLASNFNYMKRERPDVCRFVTLIDLTSNEGDHLSSFAGVMALT